MARRLTPTRCEAVPRLLRPLRLYGCNSGGDGSVCSQLSVRWRHVDISHRYSVTTSTMFF